MLTIRHRVALGRRDFLRVGALGLCGPTLADLLRVEAREQAPARPKSVIYIVLGGGPSHIDAWDLKPDAPAEFRGPFNPIPTKLTGVRICELMPLQAAIMDRLALLRGIRSVENDHFLSEVYSGLPRGAGKRPAFGSVVSRLTPSDSPLPPYVSLSRASTDQFEFEKPYYAGSGHAPFRPFGEALDDLQPVKSLDQLQDRRQLLTAFDSARRELDRGDTAAGADKFRAQALDIITSPKVREAFDLNREPDKLLAAYGHNAGKYPHQTVKDILYPWDARPFLLARRLVEAGVRVVTLRAAEWDHHSSPQGDIFAALRRMLPLLDRSLFALVNDLSARGLDKDVLVVVLGEFGRTPKIAQPGPGREHWAEAGCAVLFGGGLRMGQVVGETDSRAERSKSGTISFQQAKVEVKRQEKHEQMKAKAAAAGRQSGRPLWEGITGDVGEL
ncbi:MAG TPA: DUF1501 domain-containing protein, partial [Gemmataceae bacterium]|nr:DUF1501 domain-containing protein [Gemmataceae bacterium]